MGGSQEVKGGESRGSGAAEGKCMHCNSVSCCSSRQIRCRTESFSEQKCAFCMAECTIPTRLNHACEVLPL